MSTNPSPITRRSLLLRVRDAADGLAWREFVEIYAPLIHAYARRRGLQDADAADVAQQVLQSVAQAMPGFEYDRTKGSFRGWLFTITRNQLLRNRAQEARRPLVAGGTDFHVGLAQQADDHDEEETWNREHEQHVFRWAAGKVEPEFQPNTWRAFWEVSVAGRPVAEVAQSLGMSTGAVYIAKSRVTTRLREVIQSAEEVE